MVDIQVAHTSGLEPATLRETRELLDVVFDGELTEDDWEHCLGGIHVLARESGVLVGHASVVQRRLLHGGRALRTGYVEGVGVRADRRGRGHGAALMSALESVIRGAYDLGALASTDEALAFYPACGWTLWRGPASALTPAGIVPSPDVDGGVFVLPVAVELDVDGELTCDWRDGEVW